MIETKWGKKIAKDLYLVCMKEGEREFFLVGPNIWAIIYTFHLYRDEIQTEINKPKIQKQAL